MAILLYTDDDNPITLPERFELCPCCEGRGTSSGYLGAFTREELYDDPDFAEDYLAGRYDRPCQECQGLRVVAVVDEDRCPPNLLEEYRKQQADEADCRDIERQERLMEGGWRELGWYGE